MVEVSHARVARDARAQRGRVTLAQLKAAGRGRGAVRHDTERGRLHREHRGVYAVGHEAKPRWADEAAALLAGGDDATVAYRSALELWGVLPPRPGRAVDIVVTTPRANRAGITVHRTRRLNDEDRTRRWDLPVTSIERALLDAAEQVDFRELEAAYNEALAKGLTTPQRIYELLARSPGRRGVKRLKALLSPDDGYTRNAAERRLRKINRDSGAPRCLYNVKVGPYVLDGLFPEHNTGIEVDGYDPHYTPRNFDADLRRQNDLKLTYGIELLRFSWRTIRDEPLRVAAQIAAATSRGTTRA